MTNKELAKLLEIATPGEFRAVDEALLTNYGDESEQYQEYEPEMSALIAAAVNELPRLLRETEEAQARIEEKQAELKQFYVDLRDTAQQRDTMRAALSSCIRTVRHKKLTDAEKLEHIDRIARKAAPPSILRNIEEGSAGE